MSKRPDDACYAALARIQAKLDRWELEHLREHASELAATNEMLRERLAAAEERADWWHDQVMSMQEQLADDLCVGMTRDGHLGIVQKEAA